MNVADWIDGIRSSIPEDCIPLLDGDLSQSVVLEWLKKSKSHLANTLTIEEYNSIDVDDVLLYTAMSYWIGYRVPRNVDLFMKCLYTLALKENITSIAILVQILIEGKLGQKYDYLTKWCNFLLIGYTGFFHHIFNEIDITPSEFRHFYYSRQRAYPMADRLIIDTHTDCMKRLFFCKDVIELDLILNNLNFCSEMGHPYSTYVLARLLRNKRICWIQDSYKSPLYYLIKSIYQGYKRAFYELYMYYQKGKPLDNLHQSVTECEF